MIKNTKITKHTIPDSFTISLAVVDAIPVLFFCGSTILICISFQNAFFLLGSLLVLFAGISKVLWKFIVVLKKENIWWLFIQMRIVMPIGMFIVLLSLIFNFQKINITKIWLAISSTSSIACFVVGINLMILMIVFAFKLDSSNSKANWIEQITNSFAQFSFFMGILIATLNI